MISIRRLICLVIVVVVIWGCTQSSVEQDFIKEITKSEELLKRYANVKYQRDSGRNDKPFSSKIVESNVLERVKGYSVVQVIVDRQYKGKHIDTVYYLGVLKHSKGEDKKHLTGTKVVLDHPPTEKEILRLKRLTGIG